MGLLETIIPGVVRTVAKVFEPSPQGNAVLQRTLDHYDEESLANAADITDYPVTVLPVEQYSNREIDGQRILVGDMKVTLPSKDLKLADGSALVPSAETDKLRINGVMWKIVGVGWLPAGTVAAAYVLQCRQ